MTSYMNRRADREKTLAYKSARQMKQTGMVL